MSSARLLKLAIPLVKSHGFSREALALSVLSLPVPHAAPLSDAAVSSLFGEGNGARNTLINAWLDDARDQMKSVSSLTIREVLRSRLKSNEPVLQYLPEAYALLATSSSAFPLLDPRPALKHAAEVADEACYLTKDASTEMSWYTRRASLAAIYTTAELHQFTSPNTAYNFLDSLLDTSSAVKSSLTDVELFGSYVIKSWAGIIKSSGVF